MKIKRLLIGLSVVGNLVVILLLAVPMIYSLHGESLLHTIFIQPAHERWTSQFEVLPLAADDIVFLGDSITEGGAWEELFPNLPARNRGIGGDFTTGVISRLPQITAGKPAKVFLLIGTNDLMKGVAPNEVADNILQIVETINQDSPTTQLYVQSVLPRASGYREKVEALNAKLKLNLQDKAQWIDLYPLFLDEEDGSIRNDLSNDELHLSGPGYLIWRDALRPLLRVTE